MSKNFKIEELVKTKIEKTVLAMLKYPGKLILSYKLLDHKLVDFFVRGLHLGEYQIRREVVDLLLIFIKNIPISIQRLFDDDADSLTINVEFVFDVYNATFGKLKLLRNIKKIFDITKCFRGQKEVELDYEKKCKLYYLTKFYEKNPLLIQDLAQLLENNRLHYDISNFMQNFETANRIHNISKSKFESIFSEFFKMENNIISLEEFFSFFDQQFTFKLNVLEVVGLSLERFVEVYDKLVKEITNLFEKVDIRNNGYVDFERFEKFIMLIFRDKFEDQKWKVVKYFG